MVRYHVPPNLLYTEEHEWIDIKGDIGICGITDYAQKSLSDVVFVELPEVGKKISKGDVVCTVESVKAVSEIYAPLSGELIEVNRQLEVEPGLINQSPYDKGWIFKLKLEGQVETDDLLSAEEYQKLLEEIEGR